MSEKEIAGKSAIVTGATREDKFKMVLAKTREYIVDITFFLCGISLLAPILVEKLKYLWVIISSLWN